MAAPTLGALLGGSLKTRICGIPLPGGTIGAIAGLTWGIVADIFYAMA